MTIRTATPDDAAAIAHVHVRSWQVAYRGIIPDEALGSLDHGRFTGLWENRLQDDLAEADTKTLVAEHGGAVVSFAGFGPMDDPEAPEGDGARVMDLNSFYSLPEVWGGGINRTLAAAVHECMLQGPWDKAVLWVLTANPRARRFYEARGWEDTGIVVDKGLLRGTVVRPASLYRRWLRP